MIARIGGDAFGRTLRAHLDGNAVDTRSVVRAPEPSSVAFVHRGGNEPLSFDLRLTGTADWAWTEDELAAVPVGDLAALHVGSLAMVLPPGRTCWPRSPPGSARTRRSVTTRTAGRRSWRPCRTRVSGSRR